MADSVENSVPALAVTAAVGAVVLLLILLCSVGRRADKKDEDGNRQHTFNHISHMHCAMTMTQELCLCIKLIAKSKQQ